jgi:Rieske Fe-S protein
VSDPVLSRRRALTVGAVGGLSLPLLAACGSGSGSDSASDSSDSSDSSGDTSAQGGGNTKAPSSPSEEVLVASKDVPIGGGVILAQQNVVVTRPDKGTFEGFSATCTHQGCTLASVAGGTINCGCHGSQFAITDGANVAGPSGTPAGSVAALPKVPLKVKGANIVKA